MNLTLLESPNWKDYELLDSGDGLKLERFGPYRFVRPEVQAIWKRRLPESAWRDVHGVFQPTSEESGGHWDLKKPVAEKWEMSYTLPPILRSSAKLGGEEGGAENGGSEAGCKYQKISGRASSTK